ncbi:hypothetical protein 049ML003_79 [Bacillus phage 049ML003]|nr:hypothetical protein 049ML003_79 [Bacillus phage 049ML003]
MRNCYVQVGKYGHVSDCEFHYGEDDGEICVSDVGVTFQSDRFPAIHDFFTLSEAEAIKEYLNHIYRNTEITIVEIKGLEGDGE